MTMMMKMTGWKKTFPLLLLLAAAGPCSWTASAESCPDDPDIDLCDITTTTIPIETSTTVAPTSAGDESDSKQVDFSTRALPGSSPALASLLFSVALLQADHGKSAGMIAAAPILLLGFLTLPPPVAGEAHAEHGITVNCGDVKGLYKSAECCGAPEKDMPLPDEHTEAIARKAGWWPNSLFGVDCEKATQLMLGFAGVSLPKNFCETVNNLKTVGGTDQPMCEASDAGEDAEFLVDGKAGNTNFPHGDFKVLATAGEITHENGALLTGAMDGLGAYLLDAETVRVIYQSEAYGQILALYFGPNSESVPWHVNTGGGAGGSLTGSHLHFIDYDRAKLADFMSQPGASAAEMVKNSGDLPQTMYNLKGELVGPRDTSGDGNFTTKVGAMSSNVDVDGNYIVSEYITRALTPPAKADWLMQSLCSAHLETKHQWGEGMGVEDDIFITNEEWIAYIPNATGIIGLPAHVIDLATRTIYASNVFGTGGFEKSVEINTGTTDFIAFSPSGYNGAFGGKQDLTLMARNAQYTRSDGKEYVWPQDIVPARLYLGKKNTAFDGSSDTKSFMARNGFEHGAQYAFAVDCNDGAATGTNLTRDAWHKTAKNGDKVEGAFYKMKWTHKIGKVQAFEHDIAWDFQDAPEGAPAGWCFWVPAGKDGPGKKSEHNTPDPRGNPRFMQGSTGGYFGIYDASAMTELLQGGEFPAKIPATYHVLQGSTDVDEMIELGGQGKTADGNTTTQLNDGRKVVKRFEDVDGLEWLGGPGDEDYAVIHEDAGNIHGERKFLAKLGKPGSGTDITYYFAAMSGGKKNSRLLAGVGAVAGSVNKPNAHEFSGAFDLSGLLHKGEDGAFSLAYPMPPGKKRELDLATPVNEKKMVISLQGHSNLGGQAKHFHSDRISQLLMWQPSIPGGN